MAGSRDSWSMCAGGMTWCLGRTLGFGLCLCSTIYIYNYIVLFCYFRSSIGVYGFNSVEGLLIQSK